MGFERWASSPISVQWCSITTVFVSSLPKMPATAQSFRAPLSDLVPITLCTRAHLTVAGLPFDRQSCVSEILGKFTSFFVIVFSSRWVLFKSSTRSCCWAPALNDNSIFWTSFPQPLVLRSADIWFQLCPRYVMDIRWVSPSPCSWPLYAVVLAILFFWFLSFRIWVVLEATTSCT